MNKRYINIEDVSIDLYDENKLWIHVYTILNAKKGSILKVKNEFRIYVLLRPLIKINCSISLYKICEKYSHFIINTLFTQGHDCLPKLFRYSDDGNVTFVSDLDVQKEKEAGTMR